MSGAAARSWEFHDDYADKTIRVAFLASMFSLALVSTSRVPSLIPSSGCVCASRGVFSGFLLPPTSPKHVGRWSDYAKLALGMNASVNVCVYCTL